MFFLRAESALLTALGQCIAISPTHEMMEKIGWIGEGDFDWMEEAGKQVIVGIHCHLGPTEEQVKGFNVLFEHHAEFDQMLLSFIEGNIVRVGEFDEKEAAVLAEKLKYWNIDATLLQK